MPVLTDATAIRDHLRLALDGRDHWTFATADPRGHAVLAGLCAVLALRGVMESDVSVARFAVLVVPAGQTTEVMLLSVRKAVLPAADVERLLEFVGGPAAIGEQSIFVLGDDGEHVAGLLELVAEGKCFAAGSPEVN